MIGYIYLTHDILKNKVYVGQHKSEIYDDKYFGSGLIIKNMIKKRKESLKNYVLEWCETKEELDFAEQRWIELFREECGNRCINIANGGQGGILGDFHRQAIINSNKTREITKEQLEKTKQTFLKKYGVENAGQIPEVKIKNSQFHKGRKASKETREKMSEARKGEKSWWYGKHLTEETKKKLSEAKKEYYKTHDMWNKGKIGLYHHSEETKEKMRKPKKKFYWKTSSGEIKEMSMNTAKRHHPDWVLIGPAE